MWRQGPNPYPNPNIYGCGFMYLVRRVRVPGLGPGRGLGQARGLGLARPWASAHVEQRGVAVRVRVRLRGYGLG